MLHQENHFSLSEKFNRITSAEAMKNIQKLLTVSIVTLSILSQVIGWKFIKYPTPFPIITLPYGSYNTIYPPITLNFTFPTVYTTRAGATLPPFPTLPPSGGATTLPPFPTLPPNAHIATPAPFPTLPAAIIAPTVPQVLPPPPGIPPPGLPPPIINPPIIVNPPVLPPPPPPPGVNPLPAFPTLPSGAGHPGVPPAPQLFQCPPATSLCPITPGGQPPLVNILQPGQPPQQINPFTNCPCIDPRIYYGVQQQNQNFQGQDCITSSRAPGFCTNIRVCEQLNRFSSKDNYFELIFQSIQTVYIKTKSQSSCNYNGSDLLICCPYQRTTTTPIPSHIMFAINTLLPLIPPIITTPLPITSAPPIPLTSFNTCGLSNFSHIRIVGGNSAKLGQYPWLAALGYLGYTSGKIEFYCAGSLITVKHILTTAHCINDNLYLARLGQHDTKKSSIDSQVIDVPIETKTVHENYNPTLVLNDIAILKLSEAVPLSERIRTICLPLYEPLRSKDLSGYHPFIAGWGTTGFQKPISSILQTAQVRIIPLKECEQKYRSFFPNQIFDNRVMCAGFNGKDTCQGDSGGPLMLPQVLSPDSPYYYFVLIGLVSYGYECANNDFPGVYTRVAEFIPWIQEHLLV